MNARDLLAAVIRGEAVDWPGVGDAALEAAVLDAALDHRVEALVVWRLRNARSLERWPAKIRESLVQVAHHEALLELGRAGELQLVTAALGEATVPSLLMKGAALAYSRYPEPWLRSRNDNDLLIRVSDVQTADRVLTELGYRPATNALPGELANHQLPYIRTDRLGFRHTIDLHWRISNRPLFANVLSFDELAGQAITLPALGDHARAPSDVHELIIACLHPVSHHRNRENLVWCYDIHLLASRLGPSQFDRFAAVARSKQLAAICRSGLARATAHFHTIVPAAVTAQLQVTGEASEAYLGPAPWRGDPRLADVQTLVGWRAKLQLIREIVLPNADYMLKEYQTRSRVLLPALHAHRLVRGTWRLIRRFAQ